MAAPKVIRRNISQKSELIYDTHEYGINYDTREIFVHSWTGGDPEEEPGVDYRLAGQFIKNLSILTHLGTGSILVHMITCGGDWNYGMAMYDAIKACPCSVRTLSYAHARSMSSIIIQAADYRILHPHTDFLIHMGEWAFSGNTTSAEAELDQLKIATDQMLNVYTDKGIQGQFFIDKGWDSDQIKHHLDQGMRLKQEWYMDSRTAISYGLADAVFGDKEYEDISALLKE